MKKMMKLLATLLVLCLLMSGVAAMATVEANLDADGKLTVTENDVTNTSEK